MKEGDKVRKKSGYQFEGTIVSLFKNSVGHTRLVVEHDGSGTDDSGGMLHIFSISQLQVL